MTTARCATAALTWSIMSGPLPVRGREAGARRSLCGAHPPGPSPRCASCTNALARSGVRSGQRAGAVRRRRRPLRRHARRRTSCAATGLAAHLRRQYGRTAPTRPSSTTSGRCARCARRCGGCARSPVMWSRCAPSTAPRPATPGCSARCASGAGARSLVLSSTASTPRAQHRPVLGALDLRQPLGAAARPRPSWAASRELWIRFFPGHRPRLLLRRQRPDHRAVRGQPGARSPTARWPHAPRPSRTASRWSASEPLRALRQPIRRRCCA